MSEFQKIVNKARAKLDPDVVIKPQKQVEYIVPTGYAQEIWPANFKFQPKIGESVASRMMRKLVITDITHTNNGVIITLGRDMGGSTGVSGGGGKVGSLEQG